MPETKVTDLSKSDVFDYVYDMCETEGGEWCKMLEDYEKSLGNHTLEFTQTNSQSSQKKKKKKNTAIIISIAVLLILIAIWYFKFYKKP